MGSFRNVGTHKNEGIGTNSGPDYKGNTNASGATDKTGQPLKGKVLVCLAHQFVEFACQFVPHVYIIVCFSVDLLGCLSYVFLCCNAQDVKCVCASFW